MRLSTRERKILISAAAIILVWIFYAGAISPARERVETLKRVIPEKREALNDIHKMSAEFTALRNELGNLKNKAVLEANGFELLPFLESMTRKYGLKVSAMKQEVLELDTSYSLTVAEITLEELSLDQMVQFLYRVISSEHLLKIKSLYTRKNTATPASLDAVIQISTLKASTAF